MSEIFSVFPEYDGISTFLNSYINASITAIDISVDDQKVIFDPTYEE